jgi:hypothetical protein
VPKSIIARTDLFISDENMIGNPYDLLEKSIHPAKKIMK